MFVAMAKSPAFVPVIAMDVRPRVVWPEFAIVMLVGALAAPMLADPKLTLVGVIWICADAIAVPERATVWGLPGALSEMVSDAVLFPADCGVNLTVIEQGEATWIALGQLFACVKSAAFVPEIEMPCVRPSGALPVFARSTV